MADAVSVSIPQETVNDESVRILEWKVPTGAPVVKDQLICDVETSKAVMEIYAPQAGIVEYTALAGDEVPVGAVICRILPGGQEPAEPALPPPATELTTNGATAAPAPPRFTPLARALAGEYGLDPLSFAPGSMVRRDDVLRKAGKLPPETPGKRPRKREPDNEDSRPAENLPVPGVPIAWVDLPRRKTLEARTLNRGRAMSLQSSVTAICRPKGLRPRLQKLSPGAGVNALTVFEAARLLRKYPVFNAIHDRGRIGQYGEVNIAWAIDGGEGLVAPVIRQTDQKSIHEIAAIMQRHIEGYVSNELSPSDFAGGTFTVTDLSGDGISFFEPLISQGQSAILGIGSDSAEKQEELLYLTLAFDHQISEGRKAAHFLSDLCRRLEAHGSVASEPSQSPDDERYCLLCARDSKALQDLKAILLKSEIPSGFVCSLCVGGGW
ncbi:MAG TPA: 2-oxo acid dehydrogenase subunit E2 [Bryobacteraceae bacterium]|nr:2-oxo acid dehydrogenase subunit E2 [Bryobacteraceae bacterium]